MRKIYWFWIAVFCVGLLKAPSAAAKDATFSMVDYDKKITSLEYNWTRIPWLSSSKVTEYSEAKGYTYEVDWIGKKGMTSHAEMTFNMNQQGQALLDNSSTATRTEFYNTFLALGLKFYVPWRLAPWVGAGIAAGQTVISDPNNRRWNDFMVIVDRENRWTKGTYVHGGMDLWITPEAGVRAGFTRYFMGTDEFSNLGSSLEYNVDRYSIGIVVMSK